MMTWRDSCVFKDDVTWRDSDLKLKWRDVTWLVDDWEIRDVTWIRNEMTWRDVTRRGRDSWHLCKTFIQCKFDYGISIWGMTTQSNLNRIQRKQNRPARIILGITDYRNTCGITLVKQLGLQTIRERRDYFLTKFSFQSIMGIAPDYLSTRIVMKVDIHGYNTRSFSNSDVNPPQIKKKECIFGVFFRSLATSLMYWT